MKDKVSVDGVRKEKERLTTDHQPLVRPYLFISEFKPQDTIRDPNIIGRLDHESSAVSWEISGT